MEVEIKAICSDFKEIEKLLKIKEAEFIKKAYQTDIYYNAPNRDLRETNEYIRVRYSDQNKEGIFAYHVNINEHANKEYEVKIDDFKVFIQILETFGFKQLGKIEKERIVYMLNGFVITLDDVKNIGKFMEIETNCEKESEINDRRDECISLLENLHISRENLTDIWLANIATGKQKILSD